MINAPIDIYSSTFGGHLHLVGFWMLNDLYMSNKTHQWHISTLSFFKNGNMACTVDLFGGYIGLMYNVLDILLCKPVLGAVLDMVPKLRES